MLAGDDSVEAERLGSVEVLDDVGVALGLGGAVSCRRVSAVVPKAEKSEFHVVVLVQPIGHAYDECPGQHGRNGEEGHRLESRLGVRHSVHRRPDLGRECVEPGR